MRKQFSVCSQDCVLTAKRSYPVVKMLTNFCLFLQVQTCNIKFFSYTPCFTITLQISTSRSSLAYCSSLLLKRHQHIWKGETQDRLSQLHSAVEVRTYNFHLNSRKIFLSRKCVDISYYSFTASV